LKTYSFQQCEFCMVIHLIHHPVSARKFVEPVVKSLNSNGIEAELWIENRKDLRDFVSAVDCPKSFAKFDITINPFALLARCMGLLKIFLKLKPRAIHAHQTRAAFIPLLSALIARIPIRIYRNGGTPYLGYRGPLRVLLWLLEFLNCYFATHVITVSHSIRKKMIQHRLVRESKCEVLGEGSSCGIDLVEFSAERFDEQHMMKAKQELRIGLDKYVVLYIGRPFKRKGFHALLSAWQCMGSSNSENVLLLAGCDDKDMANAVGSSIENVIALGYVKDLRSCYAACDVVVLPSWHEGFPYSLLEGAAAGKALVGSNVPGIDSAIKHNETGLLVPVGEEQALATALITLRDDPELRKRFGLNARSMVEEHFDRKILEKELLDYYERVGLMSHNT